MRRRRQEIITRAQRLTQVGERPVALLDRLAECDIQHALMLGLLLRIAVQTCVVERQTDARGKLVCHVELELVVAPARIDCSERDRPQRAAARAHGGDDERAWGDLAHQSHALRIVGNDLLDHLGREVRNEHRSARAQYTRDRIARAEDRVAGAQSGGELRVARVRVGDGHAPHSAFVVQHVDNAPVGDAADGQVGHLAQAGFGVERRAQHGRGGRQKVARDGQPLAFGDVAKDVDDELQVARLVVDGGRSQDRPSALAGVAIVDLHDHLVGGLASQHPLAWQVVWLKRLARLLEQRESSQDRVDRRAKERLDGVKARDVRGHLVGIHQPPVLVLNGYTFADALQNGRELITRAPQVGLAASSAPDGCLWQGGQC